jgi:hypothetical protein
MAAGLGFKTFNTGDVLSAGDTNGYLMQGVLVFADAAARTAAITSPQEGQTSYLKDTDVVQTYSGAGWVTVGGSSSLNLTSVASGSLNSGTSLSLTGLTQDFLQLYLYGITYNTSNSSMTFTLNNDTSAVYDFPQLIADGTSYTRSFPAQNNTFGPLGDINSNSLQDRTSNLNGYVLTLQNCKSAGFTSFAVTSMYLSAGANRATVVASGVFKSAAAITSIQVTNAAGNTFNGTGTYSLIGG